MTLEYVIVAGASVWWPPATSPALRWKVSIFTTKTCGNGCAGSR
jgi:hypothetical protein